MPRSPRPLPLSVVASRLLEGARTDGGATVTLATGEAPTSGFMVGRPGIGVRIPLETVTAEQVESWLQTVGDARHVGSWVDGPEIFLDVSDCYSDRGVALIVADSRDELAIWDIANGAEIRVTA